jgi:molybdopterin-guanine dinucleotide biosynthesis protein A
MPFVSARLIRKLIRLYERVKRPIFCAFEGKAGFPCILPSELWPKIQNQIAKEEYSLQALARAVQAQLYRPTRNEISQLLNLNTPDDWARAIRLWQRKSKPSTLAKKGSGVACKSLRSS